MVYGSLVELNADLPRLIERARRIVDAVRAFGRDHLESEIDQSLDREDQRPLVTVGDADENPPLHRQGAVRSRLGLGVGGAMTGMRPVVDIMFGDFLGLAMDQIVNQAAKVHYMSGGKLKVPMVVRTTLGATRRTAAQHSQSLHAWVSHIPGLKVVLPSTPYDAKGLLKTAIRDDNPVIFFEDKMMFQLKGLIPDEEYTIPFGVADIKRAGTDATIVARSLTVPTALKAAEELEKQGVSCEVIDPRTIRPLDINTIIESVKKTNRIVIAEESHPFCGVAAEISAEIAEQAFDFLDAPVKRVSGVDVPMPYAKNLEDMAIPDVERIVAAVREVSYL